MKNQNTRHICLAFPCNNRSYRGRLSGALRYLSTRPDVEFRVIDISSLDLDGDCRRLLTGWRVDGLIYTMPEHAKAVLRHMRPRTDVLRAVIDSPCAPREASVVVRFDARSMTDPVINLLLQRGFANFAFFGSQQPVDAVYSDEVEVQFADTLRALGKKCFTCHVDANVSMTACLQRTAKWVAELPKPCGVMCYSDDLARDLIDACRFARVRVPEQIAIVGIDDAPDICEQTIPTLTSILPDFDSAGYLAAELLVRALRRKSLKKPLTGSYGMKSLTERGSTRDLRGCGRFVSLAMEQIRTRPLTGLSAGEIAKNLNISRRLLEMHFKKVIGHGIHAEILKRRLETVKRLLQTTSEPIRNITETCGFHSPHAAQISFKKHYGVQMSAIRKTP